MSNPLVSIIIPVYNAEKYIKETLDSVKRQSYRPIQLIMVDDGSTDDSSKIMHEWIQQSDIRDLNPAIYTKKNGGSASARNYGLDHAYGELVAFLDADDVYADDRLEKLVPILLSDDRLGVVYSAYRSFSDDVERSSFVGRDGYSIELLARECCVVTGALIKKIYIDAVGGFDEDFYYIEDYDLWSRLALICGFKYVEEALLYYRIHPDNKTKEVATKTCRWYLEHTKVKTGMLKRLGVYKAPELAVLLFGGIGDLIAYSVAIKWFKAYYPEATVVHFVYDSPFKDCIEHNPYIDDIIVCNSIPEYRQKVGQSYPSFRPLILDYYFRYGPDFWKVRPEEHLAEQYCHDMGVHVDKEDVKPELFFIESDYEKPRKLTNKYGDYIVVEAQTRTDTERKNLSDDQWSSIFEHLDDIGLPIITLGNKDVATVDGFKNIFNERDLSIRETALFMKEANFCITQQSGLAWVADAVRLRGVQINCGSPFSYAGRLHDDIMVVDQGEPFSPESICIETALEAIDDAKEKWIA